MSSLYQDLFHRQKTAAPIRLQYLSHTHFAQRSLIRHCVQISSTNDVLALIQVPVNFIVAFLIQKVNS